MSNSVLNRELSTALGVQNGSFKLRPHTVTYKPHVLFRRVEIQPQDNESEGKKSQPLVYFALFAAKTINVKPGKEILFGVRNTDGDDEHACILEALLPRDDQTTKGEAPDSDTPISSESTEGDANVAADGLVPPKMRKTWARRPSGDVVSECECLRVIYIYIYLHILYFMKFFRPQQCHLIKK
jgi:hypothetical protein